MAPQKNDPLDRLTEEDRRHLSKRELPEHVHPMLATLTDDHFSDPDWIYERKLDGERVILRRSSGHSRLFTRNGNDVTDTYPEIARTADGITSHNLIADGEVVAFDNSSSGNVTSFSRLQGRMQLSGEDAIESPIPVYLYLFDLIHLGGFSLEDVGLRSRKRVLKAAFDWNDRIRYTAHRNQDGEAYLDEACSKGWEGIIAKEAASTYVHSRSRKWLKFKCVARQEFVIGGYTDPKGERKRFGALLIGTFDDGDLKYAGKVGTGFDDELLESLGDRLDSLHIEESPFADDVREAGARWTRPELVCEVGFTEWTDAGRLRHPRFLGLRRDKPARDVKRETPESMEAGSR